MLITKNPLDPVDMVSLRHWDDRCHPEVQDMDSEAVLDCGWGRLIFGQTFSDPQILADVMRGEQPGRRDIALYLRDPHVVVALAPQELFIDPSYTYRLALDRDIELPLHDGWSIRSARPEDSEPVRRIYQMRKMVAPPRSFLCKLGPQSPVDMLVAHDSRTDTVIGVVTGVDHVRAFSDPDGGSSLWALACDPQSHHAGVGEGLSRALAERYQQRGRTFMDLSVLHDNTQAIALYERLGFVRVPVYGIKKKNPINEPLFLGPDPAADLNIYAGILVREARRRGISVDVIDAEAGYFRLVLGGRAITCRESLSELTSAIAMSRCDDKRVTLRVLAQAGISVPAQMTVGPDTEALEAFVAQHGRVVVKPARGEQGQGVRVDLEQMDDIHQAIQEARRYCDHVIVEQMVAGDDLRIVVIDHEVVAAATRRPATVQGDGRQSVRSLIEKQSHRRQMATAGESRIPIDEETRRCLGAQGYSLDDVPPPGVRLQVRKTANLHTGGTIHDVTALLHPALKEAAERASRALEIPLVGFDFLLKAHDQPDYVVIEANERPGLANHEPQPTAERFIDLLFPQTRAAHRECPEKESP